MKTTFAVLAAAAAVASAQGIPAGTLIPTGGIPSGAKSTYPGKFEITVVLAPTKRDLQTRQSTCSDAGALVAQLSNGILTDAQGRIGGIVANGQFQFDGPPSQTGTIYNGGWSVLTNGSLAIGPSAVFYQCLSGTFYNLYDRSTGAQCQQVLIDIIPCGSAGGAVATQSKDGQPAGPSATQISDGQIQATSAKSAVTQIGDGQIQASSARPVPVSQYTDGQIQVTTVVTAKPTPVTQISDGQIQATSAKSSAKPVTQISDGQIQATSAKPKPVTQISDGQIQATSAKPVPVTQISDGQIQATSAKSSTLSRVPVTQISDGQIQATSATTSAPARFTGAANALSYGSYGVAAVGAAFMALL